MYFYIDVSRSNDVPTIKYTVWHENKYIKYIQFVVNQKSRLYVFFKGGVHKLRLQILPIFDHLPTSVYIG